MAVDGRVDRWMYFDFSVITIIAVNVVDAEKRRKVVNRAFDIIDTMRKRDRGSF